MKGAIVAVTTLLGLLLAAVLVVLWAWREMGEVEISGHGMIALVLGATFSFLVGAGLMALVFFSNRRGYDEEAHRADPSRPEAGDSEER